VIRRVGVERLELVGIGRGAIVVDPEATGRELVEAQHVHHADCRKRCGKQLRALVGHGTDQQSAIRATVDAEVFAGGDALLDQVLSRADEVVEHILLAQFRTGLVPVTTILAAAAEVGDRVDAAGFHPRQVRHREVRRQRDVEAAVAIQQRRRRSIRHHILAMGDEHRHTGAVFRGVEHLAHGEVLGIEIHFGLAPDLAFATGHVVAVQGCRAVEAGVAVEGLGLLGLAAETAGRADPGKRDFAHQAAVQGVHPNRTFGIFQIAGDEVPADMTDALQHVFALGNELHPRIRRIQVDRDQAVLRRTIVGIEEHAPVKVADETVVVGELIDQHRDLRVRVGQILPCNPIAVVGAVKHRDHQEVAVVADAGGKAPLGLVRALVDQRVIGLGVTETVVVNLLVQVQRLEFRFRVGFRIATVVEAAAVRAPRHRGELQPFQLIGQQFTRGDVDHAPAAPVRAAVLDAVGQAAAVRRRHPLGKAYGTVLGPLVRIDQHPRLGVEAVLNVQHRLVLQPVVAAEEIMLAALDRQAETLVVPQRFQPLGKVPTGRQGFEVGVGDGILRRDPFGDLRGFAHVVFKPAVGIGHRGAVVVVKHIHGGGVRVFQNSHGGRRCFSLLFGAGGEQQDGNYSDNYSDNRSRNRSGNRPGEEWKQSVVVRHRRTPARKQGSRVYPRPRSES